MEEPSVLDYLKSKLNPWKHDPIDAAGWTAAEGTFAPGPAGLPSAETAQTDIVETQVEGSPHPRASALYAGLPWRGLAALFLAFAGQFALRPTIPRDYLPGVLLLGVSMALLVWAYATGELRLAPLPEADSPLPAAQVGASSLLIGGFLALVAFVAFGSLEFSLFNLILLALALWFVARGFWTPDRAARQGFAHRLKSALRLPWKITLSASGIAALGALIWSAYFRFYRLAQVPPEMNSDHAEKFLDVLRVLSGQTLIFFSNNGGREALQFYLVAGLHRVFGLPLDFTILKLTTSLVGFLVLPFLYLIGKELGGSRLGLLAFLFAGIAYWPNVVSRVGLRLPFYMLFSAALTYFLVRGFRHARRSDFICAGIILGLGFYGYSADRILPFLVVVAAGLYLLHTRSAEKRLFAVIALLTVAAVSLVIFVPLLRYMLAEPEGFFMRTFTRMGSWERPIEGPILSVFWNNNLRALSMFSWEAGNVWPISIPGYPALSTISGGLFYLGAGLLFLRYLSRRDWLDLFLLLSIPIFLLPSTLAIAFPDENPNLYRTGGAFVPVFLSIAFAMDSLMTSIERGLSGAWGRQLAVVLAVCLLLLNSVQDYDLVFDRYYQSYLTSSWNSSEMGQVARDFIEFHRLPDNVWVVGYPNWVDTRLVANNAGYPGRDYELKIEEIAVTTANPGAKLFILNPEDSQGLEALQRTYPQGLSEIYPSRVESKDFVIFYVLPAPGG